MDFTQVAESRRSVRHFKESGLSETESRAKVTEILTFVSENAPSWKNSQTHRYFVAFSKEKMASVTNALWERNRPKCDNAIALFVTCFEKDNSGFSVVKEGADAGKKVPDNECGNEWGAYDLGLSDAILTLKARELGLDTLIMGLRDSDDIRKSLDIPASLEIMSVISLGVRESEPVKPGRKTLEEICKIC